MGAAVNGANAQAHGGHAAPATSGVAGSPPALDAATALTQARQSGLPRLEALCLLETLSGRTRPWLIAHDAVDLGPAAATRWTELLSRRLAGEPLAYLVGGREFHGLWLNVNAAVLDPRPDTETLVDWAIEILRQDGKAAPRVLDLGTGSGAIALAIKHAVPGAEVTAVDLSPGALDTARRNGERLGLPVQWLLGDWWEALRPLQQNGAEVRHFDLIVSNPPYIAEHDPHLPALQHEPMQALVSGVDGLDALRLLVTQASDWLRNGAWLLLEHGHDQAAAVVALFATPLESGGRWADIDHRRDLPGHVRCTGARWQHHPQPG
jgi:release factor glutamine methyltransferase